MTATWRMKKYHSSSFLFNTIFTLFIFITVPVSFADNSIKKEREIYLVRHAEKLVTTDKNPELTKAGVIRAKQLAEFLVDKNISKIFSTDYKRTIQTAAPLAKQLNLKIHSYDPRQLKTFSEAALKESGNLLIVGHSNTTPMLVHLLGGNAHGAIDESEYDRLYKLTTSNDKIATELLRSQPVQERLSPTAFKANFSRLSNQTLNFQMLHQDNPIGTSVQTIRILPSTLLVSELTQVKSMGIDAKIDVTIDNNTLAPLRMSMTGTMGSIADIQLQWEKETVEGHTLIARAPFDNQGKISLKSDFSPKTLERSSAILLAHLADVQANQPFAFEWFDAYNAQKRLITVTYQGRQTIKVPAGTFETDVIRYEGGAPSQLFYVSKEKVPKIVRIDVISMPWRYELVDAVTAEN